MSIRVGLRFDRRDATFLKSLAAQVRSGERPGAVGGLALAADAAETGEPLIIQCESVRDAKRQATRFVRLGCYQPAIEELTGQRPAK